ncbi:hypothetical protein B0H16DRAFT_1885316, partial [Mycena metata]
AYAACRPLPPFPGPALYSPSPSTHGCTRRRHRPPPDPSPRALAPDTQGQHPRARAGYSAVGETHVVVSLVSLPDLPTQWYPHRCPRHSQYSHCLHNDGGVHAQRDAPLRLLPSSPFLAWCSLDAGAAPDRQRHSRAQSGFHLHPHPHPDAPHPLPWVPAPTYTPPTPAPLLTQLLLRLHVVTYPLRLSRRLPFTAVSPFPLAAACVVPYLRPIGFAIGIERRCERDCGRVGQQ